MGELGVSLGLLALVVLSSELVRRVTARLLSGSRFGPYVAELVSTLQLCACTHELKLLGDAGRVEPGTALTLTYVITVVHTLTFRGALGNPTGALERLWRGALSGRGAAARITCQFVAAVAARPAVRFAWALGLSDLHARHKLREFHCGSPINGPLLTAVAVETACAFAVHTAAAVSHRLDETYRVHVIAAVVTLAVYAGGSTTGAVFNPALAFSTQFPCSGSTFMEYSLVYWLGPLLGMGCFVLLFDKGFPDFLTKESNEEDQTFNDVRKKKMK